MEKKIQQSVTGSDLSLNDNINSAKTIFDRQSKRIGNIYQQPIFTLPSDDKDDYIAATFQGPKKKANRLHDFPRLGYTNDITSLMSLLPLPQPGDRLDKLSSNIIKANNPINLTIDGQPIQQVQPTTTSQTYTTKDGSDYAKGIAGLAAIIFAIYILWGTWLIMLRCGRMDCCFRMCQYGDKAWRKRSKRRRSMNQGGEDGDVNSGVRSEQDEEDEDTGCCCYTCHERIAVKGGCCTRHIFCGWMAGKKVKLPTSSSIKRENKLREKSFIKFDGIKSVSEKVGSGIVISAKSMKKGSSTVVKEGSDNSQLDDVPVAETAVPATTEDESPPNTAKTEQPQDPSPPTASWVAEKQRINHDYLFKRQASARRTILTLRIVFLVASTLVLVCSSVLLAKGWQGVNSIVDSSQNTLDIVNEQVSLMNEGIEKYINTNEQLKQDRLDFEAKTEESSDGTANGNVGWCPASVGNGEIEVVVPLSQMLLRGNLLKIAFVEEIQEKASNIKDTTGDLVDKAQETAGGVKDTVGDINLNVNSAGEVVGGRKMVEVVGWSEAVADKAGVNASEVVDNMKDTVDEVVEVVEDTVDVVKEKTMTVITFLDEIRDDGFIGKVLKVARNKATDVVDDQLDENKRIAKIVATLRGLVKTLVKRISEEDAQRLLQSGLLKETEVTKDGIKYTVLDLVDDGADSIGLDYGQDGIIFRGYNLTDLFNANITISVDVQNLSKTVNERLSGVSSRITDIFTTLYTSLENVQYQTQSAQSSLDSILPYYYFAVSFVFVVMLLTLIFMIAVVLAWKDKQPRLFRHMNDAIVCPIFIISTLFMWIFTVVFLVLGLVSGDFCYDTPDIQVTQMMEQVLTGVSKIAYNFGYYYVNGCPASAQPRLMGITFKVITTAWNGIEQLGGLLKSVGAGPLSIACGNAATDISDDNPIQAVSLLAVSIAEHFADAARAVFGLAEVVLCRNFNPIYTSLAHNVLCTDFINLVSPMLWCMFVISICSMVMITLRVAWHELLPSDVKGVEDEISEADEEENAEVEESTPPETRAMERDAGGEEEDSMPQSERGNVCTTEEEAVTNESEEEK